MTRELANVLASLFSKGFGIPVKDEVDEASHDKSQTASGTGMGEGSGLNDVSDQITDEDQLLGTSEKACLLLLIFYFIGFCLFFATVHC